MHDVITKEIKKYIGHKMLVLVWYLFFVNLIGYAFHLYWIFWWLDMPMHFLGGMFVGFLVLYCVPRLISNEKKYVLITFFVATFFIGVGWELFEISMDLFVKHTSTNWLDTLSDIGFDLAGNGTAYLLVFRRAIPIR